jgi:hypothetical protein
MAARIVRVTWAIAMLTAFAIIAEAAQQHAQLTDQQISVENKLRLESPEGRRCNATAKGVCHVRC